MPEDQLNDQLMVYGDYIKWGIIALVVLAIVYFVIKKRMRR